MTGRSQGGLPGGGTGALNAQMLLTSRKDGRGNSGQNKADTLDLNQGVEKLHSLPASEPKTQTHVISYDSDDCRSKSQGHLVGRSFDTEKGEEQSAILQAFHIHSPI